MRCKLLVDPAFASWATDQDSDDRKDHQDGTAKGQRSTLVGLPSDWVLRGSIAGEGWMLITFKNSPCLVSAAPSAAGLRLPLRPDEWDQSPRPLPDISRRQS